MTLYFKGETHKYILIFDIEFDHQTLIQFAGLLFESAGNGLYNLARSANVYVSQTVSYPFMNYTRITNSFLEENGIPRIDAVQIIEDDFLKDISVNELLVISHGLKSDLTILQHNYVNLLYDDKTLKAIDGYCTALHARKTLARNSELTLEDLSNECGFYISQAHDAYQDAWATVAVYS